MSQDNICYTSLNKQAYIIQYISIEEVDQNTQELNVKDLVNLATNL